MTQICSILVIALTLGWAGSVGALDEGTIKGDRVNVRAQAYLQSEVVTQLNKGDRVTIIDEVPASKGAKGAAKRFYKILLPKSATGWVSAKYIKDGTVTATRLNVRAGAGERFSVLGRINKGAAVETVQTVGDWIEIRPSGGVHAYVVSSLVKTDTAPPPAMARTPKPAPAPVPPAVPVIDPPIVPVPPPAESLEVVSVESPMPVTSGPIVPQPVTPIESPVRTETDSPPPAVPGGIYSETTVTSTESREPAPEVRPNELLTPPPAEPESESDRPVYKVVQPSKKKTMLGRWWERMTTRNAAQENDQPTGQGNFHEPPPAPVEGPPVVRNVSREGIIVRAWNIQAPSDWALKEVYTGKIINYLWAGKHEIPWKDLRGRTVIVTGEEAIDSRWKRTPVLHIETLKTVDSDGDGEG